MVALEVVLGVALEVGVELAVEVAVEVALDLAAQEVEVHQGLAASAPGAELGRRPRSSK